MHIQTAIETTGDIDSKLDWNDANGNKKKRTWSVTQTKRTTNMLMSLQSTCK